MGCGVHPLLLLFDRLPSYWWNGDRYLWFPHPAAGLSLIADSRDEIPASASTPSRTRSASIAVTPSHELHQDLPEGADPAKAIAEVKKLMVTGARAGCL